MSCFPDWDIARKWRRSVVPCFGRISVIISLILAASDTGASEPRLILDAALQSTLEHELSDRFSASLNAEVEVAREQRFNLVNADRGIFSEQNISITAEFLHQPTGSQDWQIFGEITGADDARLEDSFGDRSDSGVFIESLLIQGNLMGGRLKLIAGRHSIRDSREWLFNSSIDGATLIRQWASGTTSLSIGREEIFRRDLTRRRAPESPNVSLLRQSWASAGSARHSVYLLGLDGRSNQDDENLLYLGATSTGPVTEDSLYRAQIAYMNGRADGSRVRGIGLDVGLSKIFGQAPLQPSLFGGIAMGSGGDKASPGKGFRQTGLHDNKAYFGGEEPVSIYGEAFDPELSNLIVLTVGTSASLSPGLSLDLLYHRYQQHRASDELSDSALLAEPDGISRALGSEIDLVIHYTPNDQLSVRLAFGRFKPGEAFASSNEKANFAQLTLALTF